MNKKYIMTFVFALLNFIYMILFYVVLAFILNDLGCNNLTIDVIVKKYDEIERVLPICNWKILIGMGVINVLNLYLYINAKKLLGWKEIFLISQKYLILNAFGWVATFIVLLCFFSNM